MRADLWSEAELAQLKATYAQPIVRLDELAQSLGRHKTNVSRKARALGLTDIKRRKVLERKVTAPKYASTEERSAAQSKSRKEWFASNPHPRGALGMKHTEDAKRRIGAKSLATWANPASGLNSPRVAQMRSDNLLRRVVARTMAPGHTNAAGGRRGDLDNRYFRSSWEANYARFLNWLIARKTITGWAYESKTFVFEHIKRGTRAYTPDFRVDYPDGSHEWHEVKGWMNQRSRTCLARMGRCYPEEKVRVIDATWFREAKRNGVAGMIPNWETKAKRSGSPRMSAAFEAMR